MSSKSKLTPKARGFDTSLLYFHSENNYYNQKRAEGCNDVPAVDLYEDDGPAVDLNGTAYEERIFGARAVRLIREHAANTTTGSSMQPFFLYYAFHTSCVGWVGGMSPFTGDGLEPDKDFFARFPQVIIHMSFTKLRI